MTIDLSTIDNKTGWYLGEEKKNTHKSTKYFFFKFFFVVWLRRKRKTKNVIFFFNTTEKNKSIKHTHTYCPFNKPGALYSRHGQSSVAHLSISQKLLLIIFCFLYQHLTSSTTETFFAHFVWFYWNWSQLSWSVVPKRKTNKKNFFFVFFFAIIQRKRRKKKTNTGLQ